VLRHRDHRQGPGRNAGYAYEAFSELHYCSARYYDPATYQWISKDPIKADGEASAYQYCGGEPVGGVDPSGREYLLTKIVSAEWSMARKWGMYVAAICFSSAWLAESYRAKYYLGKPTSAGNDNAFKHALWNALMVVRLWWATPYNAWGCRIIAKDFADAHEDWRTNPFWERTMDLANNRTGRVIGASSLGLSY